MTGRAALRTLLAAMAMALAALVPATPASAEDVALVASNVTSPGKLAVDAAGNAYIAFTEDGGSGPDQPMFCKLAVGSHTCTPGVSLPLPTATTGFPEVTGLFPVLGPGETVYVVGPRYVEDDVAIWKSTDGGNSFAPAITEPAAFSNKTDPTSLVFDGTNFLIGAHNAGLGFSEAPAAGGAGANLKFERDLGPGGVGGFSMGVDSAGNPVFVYWNLSSPPYPLLALAYDGSGPRTSESNWVGPTKVGDGYESRLASGSGGVFMASQDYAGGQYPTALDVRRFNGTGFGSPQTLINDPSSVLFVGPAIAEAPGGGAVAVASVGDRAGDGGRVVRLFLSANDGASFGPEVDVARPGTGYAIGDNTQIAINDFGGGWLTYWDGSGLHLADFRPVAGPAPKEAPKPPNYKGKSKVADTKKAGAFDLTLRLPKSCVQSRQSFFAGVGKRKRHGLAKKLGGKIRFKQVVFVFDGKKLKTKKKKPFRLLIDPGAMAAGSTHTVATKVTAVLTKGGKQKQIKRTLKGAIKAC